MANAIYPKWKEQILQGGANSSLAGTVKVLLIDTGTYTYSATHVFVSDVAGASIISRSAALGSKTYTSGLFVAGTATFSAVTGAQSEALILYIDTGVDSTSRLVEYKDTGIGNMPVTPNGGDITVTWNGSGIFQL